jgi:putative oxidoreductase
MSSSSVPFHASHRSVSESAQSGALTSALVLAGRLLFSFIFIFAASGNFSHQTIAYAAAQGVPLASIAVPLAGILSLAGGLSILLGYHARIGAWLLVLFLVPVTPMMHNFWAVKDPMMAQMQLVNFLKNLALLGGAFLISQFGAGPWSLDARRSNK